MHYSAVHEHPSRLLRHRFGSNVDSDELIYEKKDTTLKVDAYLEQIPEIKELYDRSVAAFVKRKTLMESIMIP